MRPYGISLGACNRRLRAFLLACPSISVVSLDCLAVDALPAGPHCARCLPVPWTCASLFALLDKTHDATSLVLMYQHSAAAGIPGIITAAQKNGSAAALEHMRLSCTLTQSQFYSRSNPCQCFFVLALQARLERCSSSRSPATSTSLRFMPITRAHGSPILCVHITGTPLLQNGEAPIQEIYLECLGGWRPGPSVCST